jgi:glycosyltransferase involved in cell wall biosynthesis
MRLLVVRGDLRSYTGYSNALRAHVDVLKPFYDKIVGVDLHYHPSRGNNAWAYPVITDDEADKQIENTPAGSKITILNYTTPEWYRRHPRARNVGLFFWETDRYNPGMFWKSGIRLMDEMWIPVRFMEEAIRDTVFTGKVHWLPWPQQESPTPLIPKEPIVVVGFPTSKASRFILDLFVILEKIPPLQRLPIFTKIKNVFWALYRKNYRIPLNALKEQSQHIYTSVFQNVPRKGMFLLLSEWFTFLKSKPTQNQPVKSRLLLKISTLSTTATELDVYLEVYDFIHRYDKSQHGGISFESIVCCIGKLSHEQMDSLYRKSNVLVSASLGEGFGGPVVEAALRGVPVLCSSGTSFDEILPEKYPLKMKCDHTCVSLRHQLGVYPVSARWYVARPTELSKALNYFESLSSDQISSLSKGLKSHILEYCGENRVRQIAESLHS